MPADGRSAANKFEPDFDTSHHQLSEQATPVTGAQEERVHVSLWPVASPNALQQHVCNRGISGSARLALETTLMTHSGHAGRMEGGYNLVVRTVKL